MTNRIRASASEGIHRPQRQLSMPVGLMAVFNGVLLLAYHVNAGPEEEPPFIERVQQRPFGMSNVDLMLFGAFILLAFEVLNFLVQGSGSESCIGMRLGACPSSASLAHICYLFIF